MNEPSNEEIKNYIHTICHDLVAPINSIRSYTEIILKNKKFDPATESYLNNIELLCDYGIQHITHLLEIADQKPDANFENVELEKIVNDSIIALNDVIVKKNVDILVDKSVKKEMVYCDRLAFTHLFQNLISNGIKFNKSPIPKIRIGVYTHNYTGYKDKLIIYVADNGIGIPSKDQKRIFGMGERGQEAVEFEGSGIGLTVVKETIEDHNQDIWLETGKDKGTTFFFTIQKENRQNGKQESIKQG